MLRKDVVVTGAIEPLPVKESRTTPHRARYHQRARDSDVVCFLLYICCVGHCFFVSLRFGGFEPCGFSFSHLGMYRMADDRLARSPAPMTVKFEVRDF